MSAKTKSARSGSRKVLGFQHLISPNIKNHSRSWVILQLCCELACRALQ